MTDPQVIAAGSVAAVGGGAAAWLAAAGGLYGVPSAAIVAASTGALVPALLLDPEPFGQALRHWAGAVLFALGSTALTMHFAGLDRTLAGPVAGVIGMFARDLFALARGQLPPLVAAVRERLTGKPKDAA